MRAFIVRPFGTKEGVDFDRVERELVQPALARLRDRGISIDGGTTGEISRQGNIREDMFRLLVVADLVIADVSIHNANAFYELGIRHALQKRHTFLMRSRTEHAYPFDLQTDRYFLYDAANPSASIEALVQALAATLGTEGATDSPVFQLLPTLTPHPRPDLVAVPASFRDDVERTCRAGHPGDLRLFAHEVQAFAWDQEGLRLVGDAQVTMRAFRGARETFEQLRRAVPDDVQANWRLGTISQKLSLTEPEATRPAILAQSDHAIQRALDASTTIGQRAEAHALLASNAKARWIAEFSAAPTLDERRSIALRSPHLAAMLDSYLKGVGCDLNAHYPGVNALAIVKVTAALARQLPEVWQRMFDSDEAAAARLAALDALATHLAGALTLALGLGEVMGPRTGTVDPWAVSSHADLLLVTREGRPERVAAAYAAAAAGADRFTLAATQRNLAAFQALALFEPNLSAALEVVDRAMGAGGSDASPPARVLLFTGHMVDHAEWPPEEARFPRTSKAEARARALIERAVRGELEGADGPVVGLAGGACGGDILFHEVCHDLRVPSMLYLALPPDQFKATSVQHGGPEWVDRFHALCERHPPRVLQESKQLPRWLSELEHYDIWQRNNLWTMFNALALGARHATLIALFNADREPQGPGGTAHLVAQARARGFKPAVLDARELLAE